MSASDKISAKEIIAAFVVLILIVIGIFFTVNIFSKESAPKEIEVSSAGESSANHIEVSVKVLAVDPIKGDLSARMEFESHGDLAAPDGDLKQDLRLYIPSANGKTEVDFKKGKQMPPVDAVFTMYGGNPADYPVDSYKADFSIYIEKTGDQKKSAAADGTGGTADESETPDVPLNVSFTGNIPGYKINAAKDKESDESYVAGTVGIDRSPIVLAFSIFVAVLVWGLSLAVLFLLLSVLFRGRKPELGMFSFMASLLFAYYAVRNSQPNVPPIGVYSDFVSFFWCEILVGASLLICVFTWVFRAAK